MTMELVESSVPEVKLINMEKAREIPESSDIIMKKVDSNIEYEGKEFSDNKMFVCVLVECHTHVVFFHV